MMAEQSDFKATYGHLVCSSLCTSQRTSKVSLSVLLMVVIILVRTVLFKGVLRVELRSRRLSGLVSKEFCVMDSSFSDVLKTCRDSKVTV